MSKLLIMIFTVLIFSIPYVFAQQQDYMDSHNNMKKTEKENYMSPHKQTKQGIESHMIQCREGLVLYMKSHGYHPVCIKLSSIDKLMARGWLMQHDMTHPEINHGMNQSKITGS